MEPQLYWNKLGKIFIFSTMKLLTLGTFYRKFIFLHPYFLHEFNAWGGRKCWYISQLSWQLREDTLWYTVLTHCTGLQQSFIKTYRRNGKILNKISQKTELNLGLGWKGKYQQDFGVLMVHKRSSRFCGCGCLMYLF